MRAICAGRLCVTIALAAAAPAQALPVTFTAPDDRAAGDGPRSIAVADFNADGDPDLAVADETVVAGNPPGTVAVRHGVGRAVRFTVRRSAMPRRTTLCLPPGTSTPRRCT